MEEKIKEIALNVHLYGSGTWAYCVKDTEGFGKWIVLAAFVFFSVKLMVTTVKKIIQK